MFSNNLRSHLIPNIRYMTVTDVMAMTLTKDYIVYISKLNTLKFEYLFA